MHISKRKPEQVVREIKRKTKRKFNSEEKIRIVLEGLKGEDSIASICRREGISPNLYYTWSKSFLEAGKKRLSGDTMREANTDEVTALRKEREELQKTLGKIVLELEQLKKAKMVITKTKRHAIYRQREVRDHQSCPRL